MTKSARLAVSTSASARERTVVHKEQRTQVARVAAARLAPTVVRPRPPRLQRSSEHQCGSRACHACDTQHSSVAVLPTRAAVFCAIAPSASTASKQPPLQPERAQWLRGLRVQPDTAP